MDPFATLFSKHFGFFEKSQFESVYPQSIQPRRYDFYVEFKRAGARKMQTVWAFNLSQAMHKFMSHHWHSHKKRHPAKTNWTVKEIVYDNSRIETTWHKGHSLYKHWPNSTYLAPYATSLEAVLTP